MLHCSQRHRQIAEHYGLHTEAMQTMEEMAELSVALSHYLRGRSEGTEEICEEMADVIVSIKSLMHLLSISQESVQAWMEKKLSREEKRIQEKNHA